MSYDLMVFDTAVAPRDRTQFREWYDKQVTWQEPHNYNDPDIPAPGLREWFREIINIFPPMNPPSADDDPDNPKLTDYCLGRSVIYAAFAWSQAEHAYKQVKELAAKHGVGFFDVNGREGDIWWPMPSWKLQCESQGEIPMPLDLRFEELLNGLDSKKNSFFVLEGRGGDYIQCGGGNAACSVEFRRYDQSGQYRHYAVGRAGGSSEAAFIQMSTNKMTVRNSEVLNATDAAELFECFLSGKEIPPQYALRELDI